jgi:hypothetical protein
LDYSMAGTMVARLAALLAVQRAETKVVVMAGVLVGTLAGAWAVLMETRTVARWAQLSAECWVQRLVARWGVRWAAWKDARLAVPRAAQ